MSEAFTKGPWAAGECAMPGAVEIRDASGGTVAVVGADCPHIALIAAAPSLYEALESLVDEVMHGSHRKARDLVRDTIDPLLVKVHGEQTEQSR